MIHPIEHIPFYRELDPEQQVALEKLLREDPSAAELFRAWRAVLGQTAKDVDAARADRETFALCVLYRRGFEAMLSDQERQRVRDAAPHFDAPLSRRCGLQVIADDVAEAARAFDAVWSEHFERAASDGRGRERVQHSDRSASRRRHTRRWFMRAGIAAAVVVFAVVALLVGRRDFGGVTVTTASDEVRMVEIGDGSSVRMLGGSRLTYMPPGKATAVDRQAEFEGDGFFDIAPDERGFVLKTPSAQAVVLGTSFGVHADGERTEVVLAEGRLTLSSRQAPGSVVVLEPGQMSQVDRGRAPTAPVGVSVHEQLSWTGLFVFQSATIRDILDVLSRSYEAELSADAGLLSRQVTGRFERNQPLAAILDVVTAAVDARVEERPGGFHLREP